jgi:hypothetical protein
MWLDQVENFEIFRPKIDSTDETLQAIAAPRGEVAPLNRFLTAVAKPTA